jgi:hypothetical protein
MYMKDWISKLDEFLKLSGRDILVHAGSIAHEDAIQKARLEYEKWHQEQLARPAKWKSTLFEALRKCGKSPNRPSPRERNE